MSKKSKYFIVDNVAIAELMKVILGIEYYVFHDADKDRYSFLRVDGIDKAYGQANLIIKNIK